MNITRQEAAFKDEDNEYYHVMLDIADLVTNYTTISDPKDYAARAIAFVLNHESKEV